MPSPHVQINAYVKTLNMATERSMTSEEAAELQFLQGKTQEGRAADNATIRRLRALREGCVNLEKRRELVAQCNAGPYGTHWRFRLQNGRIVAELKPIPAPSIL